MATMTRDEAIAFLSSGTHTGKLATASLAGVPHVAPVWFVIDETSDGVDLVFNTGSTTIKGRHLTANPRASLTVDVEEYPYSFVIVHGTVTIDAHAGDMLQWSTAIAERYVPSGQAGEYGRRNAVDGELLVRLRAERIIGERDIAL